jgi:hypothetical protein
LGFYLQMLRGSGHPGFEQRYRRPLAWLLLFGVANQLFLWQWDILPGARKSRSRACCSRRCSSARKP